MPQPLSRVAPNAGFGFANPGQRSLSERPELAVLVAEAIGSWSQVEGFMLRLFVRLLGGSSAALAARIYLALEIRTAKNIALTEAVGSVSDAKVREAIKAVMLVAKSRQKERDKLAHHVWGISTDLPDALLLVDPKAFVVEGSSRDDIYVYRANDLEAIIEANGRLSRYFLKLLWIVGEHPASAGGRLLDELCNEREIAERLRHPEEPPQTPPAGPT